VGSGLGPWPYTVTGLRSCCCAATVTARTRGKVSWRGSRWRATRLLPPIYLGSARPIDGLQDRCFRNSTPSWTASWMPPDLQCSLAIRSAPLPCFALRPDAVLAVAALNDPTNARHLIARSRVVATADAYLAYGGDFSDTRERSPLGNSTCSAPSDLRSGRGTRSCGARVLAPHRIEPRGIGNSVSICLSI
jgi:hypothetical protein